MMESPGEQPAAAAGLKRAAATPHSANPLDATPRSAVPRARKAVDRGTPHSAVKPTNLMQVLEDTGDDAQVPAYEAPIYLDPYICDDDEVRGWDPLVQHLRDMVITPEKAPSIPAEPTPKKAPASSPRPADQCPTPSIFAPTMVDASPICAAKAPAFPKPDTGSVMTAPDDMAGMMNQMVQALQKQLSDQSRQNEQLQTLLQQQASEIAKLREERANSSRAASDVGSEVKGEEPSSQGEGGASGATSFEAARQRVRRMVKMRADGSYGVPQHIVDTWNRQGKARENLVRAFMDAGCNKESFVREITVQNEREKELSVVVEGDFYTESQLAEEKKLSPERIADIKAFARQNPALMRKDTYNPKMVSFNMEAEQGEDGSVVLGTDVSLNDVADVSMGGPGLPGDADVSTEGQLQLPSLEGGKRASEVIGTYMKAALGRAAKLGDTLGKMYAVPLAERTEACRKLLEKLEAASKALDHCQDKMQDIYCTGAVEGYTKLQDNELVAQYKVLRKLAMETMALESRAKTVIPKRRAETKAKAAAPKKAVAPVNPTAKAKPSAEQPAGRKTGKQPAPAARIVRLAKAIEKEAPGILGGIKIISKMDLPKGEHRLHALAKEWKMTDPHFSLFLEAFWKAYEYEQPTHLVFRQHSNELSRCIPYMLFGDEGRSLRKCPIQIVCLETVFGLTTYKNYKEHRAKGGQIDEDTMLDFITHTGKGSSFLSRLLLYALPHALYRSDSDVSYKDFWYDCMDQVARAAIRLFEDGISHRLGRFYGVCVGFKGDAPFLAKAAKLRRTFMSVEGKHKGICPDLPWEDVGQDPVWVPTIGQSRPWKPNQYSSVRSIPYATSAPEQLLQPDLFHTIKLGIGRHFSGSFLVLAAHWSYFFEPGRNSFPDVLGSDTLMVLRWIIMLLRNGRWSGGARTFPWLQHPQAADHAPLLKAVHDGCCAILTLFQVVQKQGIWLRRPVALRLHSAIDLFCSSYKFLSGECFRRQLNRFHLEPTLHQLKHFSIRIQEQLANEDVQVILNPGMFMCEMSEDFVGHESDAAPSLEDLLPWVREAFGEEFVEVQFPSQALVPQPATAKPARTTFRLEQVVQDAVQKGGLKTPPSINLKSAEPKGIRQQLDRLMSSLQEQRWSPDGMGAERQPRTIARQNYDIFKNPFGAADEFTLATKKAERRLNTKRNQESSKESSQDPTMPVRRRKPQTPPASRSPKLSEGKSWKGWTISIPVAVPWVKLASPWSVRDSRCRQI
ncbi:unnamed protein product [Symbiodinium sp. CCMP2592]|nr:unnamed protein product [Symbiodinium sp. CCMP2592]